MKKLLLGIFLIITVSLASYSDQPKYIGGSSAATTTTTEIAALPWAQNPGSSRSQILQVLKDASSIYPSRNSNLGWGSIDAGQALDEL